MEVTFRNWRGISMLKGGTANDSLVDAKGNRMAYNVSDDPLCQAEISLAPDPHGIKTFSPDQSIHFRERLKKDGDSPQLRREILRERGKVTGQESV